MREERGEVWRRLGDLAEGAELVGSSQLQCSTERALARMTRVLEPVFPSQDGST